MIIGVHAVAAFRKNPTGVEEYLQNLLAFWEKDPGALAHRFLLYTRDAISQGQNLKVMPFPFFWTQVRLSWEMLQRPPDVLFVPATALPRILPRRTVVTIHGLEFRRVPKAYSATHRRYLDWATKDATRRAERIVAVSEATKQDIVELFDVDPSRITVVHHGAPILTASIQKPDRKENEKSYYLYIGRIETKKNVDSIVRAYTRLRSRGADIPKRLVLAGLSGFGFSLISDVIRHSAYRSEIELPGYVSKEEKSRLLSGASAFIFPSRAEGFGIPILEAQQAGIPVVTSDCTAMPEVAGKGGALFVSPDDVTAIADAMERVYADQQLRENLIAAGFLNIRRFSWEETARKTLRVLLGFSD